MSDEAKIEKKDRHIQVGSRYFFLPKEAVYVPEIFNDLGKEWGVKVEHLDKAPAYIIPSENNYGQSVVSKKEYETYQQKLDAEQVEKAAKESDATYDSLVSSAITASVTLPQQMNMLAALMAQTVDDTKKKDAGDTVKAWTEWVNNIKKTAKRHIAKKTPSEHIDWPELPAKVKTFIDGMGE